MAELLSIILNIVRNAFRMLSFGRPAIDNSLNINIKCNTGNTLSVGLDPEWDIGEVKNIIAPKLGANPEEVKIIFAGKELDDSFVIKDCDLGEQSTLHAVKLSKSFASPSPKQFNAVTEVVSDEDEIAVLQETIDRARSQFHVHCPVCDDWKLGKLRVRCSKCKSGAITVDTDPKSWSDVLKANKISGHCEQDNCPNGAFAWAEFYFKCTEHVSQGENDEAVPLYLLRNNFKNIPCLACTDIKDVVFVFPCKEAHVTCLDCFRTFAVLRLRERQFVLDDAIGYTIACPAGCPDSYIDECHHFKLLTKEQYEMYQRFATEEYVLHAGGVLCPQPGCGEGIIVDPSCDKVACSNGCGYVFCRKCLQGYHLGECHSSDNAGSSDDIQRITDPTRAAQVKWSSRKIVQLGPLTHDIINHMTIHARWDEATNVAIRVTTKPCPRCRTATERSGGCMHMICTRCSFHWCWVCQTEWTRDCMGTHWFG